MSININMEKKVLRVEELNGRIGEVFGSLKILSFYPIRPEGETRYDNMKNMPWCQCACISEEHDEPVICYFPWYIVSTGIVSSCGCLAVANFRKSVEERTVRLTFEEKTMTVKEWAKELGISERCIRYRMKQGKPINEVLSPIEAKENPYI